MLPDIVLLYINNKNLNKNLKIKYLVNLERMNNLFELNNNEKKIFETDKALTKKEYQKLYYKEHKHLLLAKQNEYNSKFRKQEGKLAVRRRNVAMKLKENEIKAQKFREELAKEKETNLVTDKINNLTI